MTSSEIEYYFIPLQVYLNRRGMTDFTGRNSINRKITGFLGEIIQTEIKKLNILSIFGHDY